MAIKIHHGPNGSYKTSGAVWDDAVPAAKEGRLIITNVRGMSRERFENLFDDLPDSFDVMFISHESAEGLAQIRTWFQWAPRNAFLIFDEAQVIFPSKWSDKFLEQFDYPGGPDKAKSEDKPTDWLSAWTMHRHFNWDIILTMPNIKYLHTDIRNTSEAAYQHSNLMLLGKFMKKLVSKDYKEAMHSAQENKAPTDGSNIVALRKIDKRVFQLYDSTATGLHRDTMAGKNALASSRVVVLLGALALIIGVAYWRNGSSMFSSPLSGKTPPASAPVAAHPVSANPVKAPDVAPDRVPAQQIVPPAGVNTDPFAAYEITIKGSIWSETRGAIFVFHLTKDDRSFTQTSRDMQASGYVIFPRGSCVAELVFRGEKRSVTCLGSSSSGGGEERLGAEQRAVAAGQTRLVSSSSSTSGVSQKPGTQAANFTIVQDSSRGGRNVLQ
jgi:zona occludens toxin